MTRFYILLFFTLGSFSTYAQIAETAEEISPLLIGEKIPNINILNIKGEKKNLAELIEPKKTVLLFYRGGWCPYCNAHLSAVGEVTKEIEQLGYQILAVSPDAPFKLQESVRKQGLDYQLLSDPDGSLIQAMGIAFRAPEKYSGMLSAQSNNANPGLLPVPALFIVDTDATILFEYISPDYKQRIEAPLLLEVLKFYSKK